MATKQKFNTCLDNHPQIIYQGTDCPLCQARQKIDNILDLREDITETNIAELDRQVRRLERHVKLLERILFGRKHVRHLWKLAKLERVDLPPFEL